MMYFKADLIQFLLIYSKDIGDVLCGELPLISPIGRSGLVGFSKFTETDWKRNEIYFFLNLL
jgi:hypothetical protein